MTCLKGSIYFLGVVRSFLGGISIECKGPPRMTSSPTSQPSMVTWTAPSNCNLLIKANRQWSEKISPSKASNPFPFPLKTPSNPIDPFANLNWTFSPIPWNFSTNPQFPQLNQWTKIERMSCRAIQSFPNQLRWFFPFQTGLNGHMANTWNLSKSLLCL